MNLDDLLPLLNIEMNHGRDTYGPYHNAHEHYAVLKEEVDELWDAVKGNLGDCAHYELLQIAAVALRYIIENGSAENIATVQKKRYKRKAVICYRPKWP